MKFSNFPKVAFLALSFGLIRETEAQAELTNPTSYDISQFWPGGFSAKITIGIKREIRFGWLMKLTFTSPVTSIEIFDAQVAEVSADGQVYLLKNQNYNGRLQTHQGEVSMFFTGTQPDGSNGPPNSDLLLIELINTFETIEEALKRVGTTLERDGTGNTLDTTPSSRVNPVFNGANVAVNTPPPPNPTAFSVITTTTPPYVHDVAHAIHLSFLFFEAQRSGELSMHPKRIDWRQDSGLTDGGYHKVNLVGGYFVDHDFVKFGFPMASAMTLLAWSVVEFKEAYVQANEYRVAMDALKWAADYFIKCHTNPFEFYGQVGQTKDTNEYWGRPEDMLEAFDEISFKCTNKRPCSDLIAETAAALAATSMVFRGFDEKFQRRCMEKAMQLYKFANQYQGSYHESILDAANRYKSYNGFHDELAWAALWIAKAVQNREARPIWIKKATAHMKKFNKRQPMEYYNWDDKRIAVHTMLASLTKAEPHWGPTIRFCDKLLPGGGADYTPAGLLFLTEWGTLEATTSSCFLCLIAAENNIRPNVYRLLAKKQLYYVLGENTGQSFVVGYGKNGGPQRPYHKASSCPYKPAKCGWAQKDSEDPNPHILHGAVVAGPNPLDEFLDDRSDYQHSTVTLNTNAGFTALAAGVLKLEIEGTLIEDKSTLSVGDSKVGQKLLAMGTFAPDYGELIGME